MDVGCELWEPERPGATVRLLQRTDENRTLASRAEPCTSSTPWRSKAPWSGWGDTVLRLATSRMGSVADAEDVFQTVFMRLLQSRERFTDDEHLKAWLLRVTINCCNDVHRSPWSKRRAELDDATLSTLRASELDEPGREASDDAFGNRNLEPGDLAAALARLTPQQRTAVHLFYFEGYATDEIAQITGERSGTVRSHLHRARKASRSI